MCTSELVTYDFGALGFVGPKEAWRLLNLNYFETIGEHTGRALKVTCSDARMSGSMTHYKNGEVFNPRTPGAILPKDLSRHSAIEEGLCVADCKEVEHFIIAPHSNCMAANTALLYPRWNLVPPDHRKKRNLMRIVTGLERVGVDLVKLSEKAWDLGRDKVTKNVGCQDKISDAMIESEATNQLAKALAVASANNLNAYRVIDDMTMTVGEALSAGRVRLTIIFINLAARKFELFNPETGDFHNKDQDEMDLLAPYSTLDEIGFSLDNGGGLQLAFDFE